ncbi:MAG: hypothetical protein FWH57_03000 [Oscillospiraceae bacterium]|nr:hypothetical protein [Oscillospiraceae bacterium]
MSKRAIPFLLPALLLLIATVAWVLAETVGEAKENRDDAQDARNIYIGDIVTLKITPTSRPVSMEQIEEAFQDFEIVEIKDEPDGYSLSVRTFEVGERRIMLGNKEIVINVSSTLDDIERASLFEGDAWVIAPGIRFHWRVLFYGTAVVFALSGAFVIVTIVRKRKVKTLSPLRLFMKRCAGLSVDDDLNDSYFVDLTFYFKQYLAACHRHWVSPGSDGNTRLTDAEYIGKTSAEIMNMLGDTRTLDDFLVDIHDWLTECDKMKFTGMEVTAEAKETHCAKLKQLVERIDQCLMRHEVTLYSR